MSDSPTLLWVDERLPDTERDAGSVRVRCLWSIFQERGWQILVGVGEVPEEVPDFHDVKQVIVGVKPDTLQTWSERPTLVVLSRPDTASRFLPVVRDLWPDVPVIFDTVDLHYVREFRQARFLNSAPMLKNSLLRKRQEQTLMQSVDQVWTVSDAEGQTVRQLAPKTLVATVAWFAEICPEIPSFDQRKGLFFVGSFFHGASPNAQGVQWFLEQVFPRIVEKIPEVSIDIVGGEVPDGLRGWNGENVRVHGRVAHLEPFYDQAKVSIVPLHAGAGIKGKIIESWAHGVPVVGTSIAAEGFPEADPPAIRQANDPETFAGAVQSLLSDPVAWVHQQTAGFEVVAKHFSRSAVLKQVSDALEALKMELPDV